MAPDKQDPAPSPAEIERVWNHVKDLPPTPDEIARVMKHAKDVIDPAKDPVRELVASMQLVLMRVMQLRQDAEKASPLLAAMVTFKSELQTLADRGAPWADVQTAIATFDAAHGAHCRDAVTSTPEDGRVYADTATHWMVNVAFNTTDLTYKIESTKIW